MAAMPGLLVKSGAEGVDAFALTMGPDVVAGAIKIEDGARRARTPVTVALLHALRRQAAAGSADLDVAPPVPADLATVPLSGGDGIVGEVRAVPGLFG
jgi:L-asparaginase II